jgi:dTDP-glucose pyrophosphorylase
MEGYTTMETLLNNKVGLITAAGMARRLKKIGNNNTKEMVEYNNIPIICNSIEHLIEVNVIKIVIVVRSEKEDLIKFIKEKYSEINIKFIYQVGYIGNLIDAINISYNELKNNEVLFRLGDTFITPNPFINNEIDKNKKVKLCCFNVKDDSYKNYGVIDIKNNIVVDKPDKYISNICWGALLWKPEFTEKLKFENDFTKAINNFNFEYNINITTYVDIGTKLMKDYEQTKNPNKT